MNCDVFFNLPLREAHSLGRRKVSGLLLATKLPESPTDEMTFVGVSCSPQVAQGLERRLSCPHDGFRWYSRYSGGTGSQLCVSG